MLGKVYIAYLKVTIIKGDKILLIGHTADLEGINFSFSIIRTLQTTSLCDWFVCGLRNEATQCWLLTEHALTYQKALDIGVIHVPLTKSNVNIRHGVVELEHLVCP